MSGPTSEELAITVGAGLKAQQAARAHGLGAAQADDVEQAPDPRLALQRSLAKHYEAQPPSTVPAAGA